MRTFLSILFLFSVIGLAAGEVITVQTPDADTLTLTPAATFQLEAINESSAIVHSRQYDKVYWTLNDSGDEARIFAFGLDGNVFSPEWMDDYTGVHIPDAVNIDWEDMAVDDKGNLIVGACGNNANTRRDLALYIIREPHPLATVTTRVWRRIDFHYPEQTAFPPEQINFDCEAVFWAFDHMYLLTKHRSDTRTALYRLDTLDPLADNAATRLAEFDIGGMVTAADATPDGRKLAVLTYYGIWVFEADSDDWFHGNIWWRPIKAQQCEGICWNGDDLVVTNEQKDIFIVTMDDLLKVK